MNREENKKVWDALDNINRAKCALEALETCGSESNECENLRQALHIVVAVIRDNLETLEGELLQ